jgi:tetratricopeptide (TPR) repeat protein
MKAPSLLIVILTLSMLGCGMESEPHGVQHAADHGHEMAHHEHGHVDFPVSCNEEAAGHIETGVAQLHHMMYEQARPHFESAVEADPECAMAHWGIAMASFYPLWTPTPDPLLERGKAAVAQARELGAPTEREEGYIAAVEAFFTDPDPPVEGRPADHAARVEAWKQAQHTLHEAHPEDVDAAAFYALAEVCYAVTQFRPGEERDFTRELRAGEILERYRREHPHHPGLFHYLIHAYDSPQLADRAIEVARGYDQLAPDTPHALHMPSHIFVRLGKWDETVEWNERSAAVARRQAEVDGHAKLHYVHALDYMMYGYLQRGDEEKARETLERVLAIRQLPSDLASGYGAAAAQARYYLELGKWEEATAQLEPGIPEALNWEQVPAATAVIHFARGLGAARSGDLVKAQSDRQEIARLVAAMQDAGNYYWAHMAEAQGKAVEAWILHGRGETEQALALLREAAEHEESMDKHPVTPGEVLPIRELYGEMLLLEGRADEARRAFEASLERTPNRRNALAGIERASAAIG